MILALEDLLWFGGGAQKLEITTLEFQIYYLPHITGCIRTIYKFCKP